MSKGHGFWIINEGISLIDLFFLPFYTVVSFYMKIVVCDPISPKGIALLQQRPEFQVVVLPKRLPEAELLPVVTDAVALVVRSETKVTRKVIEAAPKLRVVGRAGVGVDNVDIEAATQHGTVVMNTPGGNTVTTAELSFAMLLSLARKVPQAHATMVAGKWDRKLFQGAELAGKTLGVLGMGRIGTEVARRAIAFGMRVIGYDPVFDRGPRKGGRRGICREPRPSLSGGGFHHRPHAGDTGDETHAERRSVCQNEARR